MANLKVSDLTDASALGGTELMLVTQSGNSRKVSLSTLLTWISSTNVGYFSGATGAVGTASASTYATKGLIFVPRTAMDVHAIVAYVDAAGAGESHYAQISSLDGTGSGAAVVSVLGTSSSVNSVNTDMMAYRYPFSPVVSLSASTPYLFSLTRAGGTGTTVLRMAVFAGGASGGWTLNAPGETIYATPQYNTIGVSAAQVASQYSTGMYALFAEGYL